MSDVSFPKEITVEDGNGLLQMDVYKIKKATIIVRSLNNNIRKRIIAALHDTPAITVTELYVKLHLKQCILSQHLAILRRAGVLVRRKEGKFTFYSLHTLRLNEINDLVKNLLE